MPVLPEVRRLGGGWETLQRRTAAFMSRVGPEGVPLIEFEEACLAEVFIFDRPAIVRALKGKRLIWTLRDGVAERVFAERPEGRRFETVDTTPLDQFVRIVGPHMRRLAKIAAAHGGIGDRESRRREAEATRQIAALIRRHVDRGLALPEIRAALVETFRADAVETLLRREPLLRPDSAVIELPTVAPPRKRIPNGLTEQYRVVAIVNKAGQKGAIKKEIKNLFSHPRPSAQQLDRWLDDCEDVGLIYSLTCKLTHRGKAGKRYFSAKVEAPRLINYVAVFD